LEKQIGYFWLLEVIGGIWRKVYRMA